MARYYIEVEVDEYEAIANSHSNTVPDALIEAMSFIEGKGIIGTTRAFKKEKDELIIQTTAGRLYASAATDPGAPGIDVSLQPKGHNSLISLALFEVKENEELRNEGETDKDVNILIWGNPFEEDYTDKIVVSSEEIKEAYGF